MLALATKLERVALDSGINQNDAPMYVELLLTRLTFIQMDNIGVDTIAVKNIAKMYYKTVGYENAIEIALETWTDKYMRSNYGAS